MGSLLSFEAVIRGVGGPWRTTNRGLAVPDLVQGNGELPGRFVWMQP